MEMPGFLDGTDARPDGGSFKQTAPQRVSLLKKIGAARNSTVISYLTSIRDGNSVSIYDTDNRILERHLENARIANAKNVDLILNTHGGSGVMGWNFHTLFRDYFPNARLGVFVPYVAYSAGTQICLGCDEIVLGRSSVLGPADIAQASAISGVLDLIGDLDKNNRINADQKISLLLGGQNALQIGTLYRYWKEDRRVLLSALNSRKNPLPEKENQKIVKYFLDGVGVHNQGIRRKEVAEAGVSFMTAIEKSGVESEIAQVFAHYANIMRLFNPLIDKRDLEADDAPVPHVIIESEYETTAAFRSGRNDRDWQTHGASFSASDQSPEGTPDRAPINIEASVDWVAMTHEVPEPARKRRF